MTTAPGRARPAWLCAPWTTAPWLMLLLPVLAAAVDAALVAKDSAWWEMVLSGLATGALVLRRG